MKAYLNNYRQSPRKVRLITNLIKGKDVLSAQAILQNLIKRGALPIRKLLNQAIANAGKEIDKSSLIIKNARVDKGFIIKRMMPRAMGRGFPIHKHTSKITIELTKK